MALDPDLASLMLAHVSDAVLVIDDQDLIQYWGPGAERLFGVSAAEALGRLLTLFYQIQWDHAEGHKAAARALDEEQYWQGENTVVLRTGEPRRVESKVHLMRDASGGRKGLLAVIRDVTERWRHAEALRASEERFRLATEALRGVVYEWDLVSATILYGPKLGELIGEAPYAPDQGGAWWEERVHPDDLAPRQERLREALQARAQAVDLEYRVRHRDGHYLWVWDSLCLTYAASEQPLRAVGCAISIDLRKRAEQALRDADLRKSEFLAMLAHELRNPLAPIRNSLHVVARTPPANRAAQGALAVIERQVAHMCRLVDDLLDLTRISRGKIQLLRQRVDVRELVRRTLDDHYSLFEQKGVQLALTMELRPLFIDGDPTRLAQVFGNLLHNAAKFTSAGGQAELRIDGESEPGLIQIAVRDTGIGIPATLLPLLFEPFVQAEASIDRSHGGLGLGLALVRKIVELHGGSVAASSPGVGQGALFVVRLPAASAAAAPAETPDPERPELARRVLVIDDNIDAADSLRLLLETNGHLVSVAYDGPEGLALARRTPLDLILCDLGLPLMDGYEVARIIRSDQTLNRVRLVALSGYALAADVARSRAAGFDAHLAKPAQLPELEKQLAQASHGESPEALNGGAASP